MTVTSPRAGLVMDSDAKVKYRGIQIGEVEYIEYAGDQAKLTLAIDSNEMRYIPSNAVVRIASTTVFGAKSVEFRAAGATLRQPHCGRAPTCRPRRCSSKSTRCSRP